MSADSLEDRIDDSPAEKVTLEEIESKVKDTQYLHLCDTQLTICVITLENGFTVTGESACASPENFNKAIGEELALKHAINKVWLLEGYLLKEKLYLKGSDVV